MFEPLDLEAIERYAEIVSGDIYRYSTTQSEESAAQQNVTTKKQLASIKHKMPLKPDDILKALSNTALSNNSEASESLKRSSEDGDNSPKRQKTTTQGPLRRDIALITNNYWDRKYVNNIVDGPRIRKATERLTDCQSI